MRIDVFTIFPDYLAGPLALSLVGRARDAGLLDVRLHDPRKWTTDAHRSVDDAPFGGGAGMVMLPEPIFAAVEAVQPPRPLLRSVRLLLFRTQIHTLRGLRSPREPSRSP